MAGPVRPQQGIHLGEPLVAAQAQVSVDDLDIGACEVDRGPKSPPWFKAWLSGQARQGFIYTPHYAASKFGVVGLTQSLAKELAPEGITVNAICPGIIHTEMWDYNDRVWGKMLGSYGPGELMKEWVEGIPMKRAGTPAEVGALVAFLASEDAGYITGQTINVDGGLIMS